MRAVSGGVDTNNGQLARTSLHSFTSIFDLEHMPIGTTSLSEVPLPSPHRQDQPEHCCIIVSKGKLLVVTVAKLTRQSSVVSGRHDL